MHYPIFRVYYGQKKIHVQYLNIKILNKFLDELDKIMKWGMK